MSYGEMISEFVDFDYGIARDIVNNFFLGI